jgi:hypothetical protein
LTILPAVAKGVGGREIVNSIRTVLKFLNNLWGLGTEKNRVVVPARQAAQSGGIDSMESIHGLLKSLKIQSLNV